MSEHLKLTVKDADEQKVAEFVAELYEMFLQRGADPGGLSHYVELLKSGTPLVDLVAAFLGADEHKQKAHAEALREFLRSRDTRRFSAVPASQELSGGTSVFPEDYAPPGEAGRSYLHRLRSGFLDRYCGGAVVLDVGYSGYDNPDRKTAVPGAIGIDVDYPGYDGIHLPFDDGTVDTVFSSHCLEHILFDHAAIREWHRVLRIGGFIVCIVPSQALYEKRRFLPSRFNVDHKRMYTVSRLAECFETALDVNSYRVRHLAENDRGFNYALGPEVHSDGCYEIEMVIEKIDPPAWKLA